MSDSKDGGAAGSQSEAARALDEIEAALDYIRTGTANMPWEAAHVAKILTVLPTPAAALVCALLKAEGG